MAQVGKNIGNKNLDFEQFLDEQDMLTEGTEIANLGWVKHFDSSLANENQNELIKFNNVISVFMIAVCLLILVLKLWPREYSPLFYLSYQWAVGRRHP